MSSPASDEDIPAVVIDNGSGNIRAGWSSDDVPCCRFNTITGKLRHKQQTTTTTTKTTKTTALSSGPPSTSSSTTTAATTAASASAISARAKGSLDESDDQQIKGPRYYIGNLAQQYREMLSLTYPIQHGMITNWDEMERVWSHTFNELKICDSRKYPVLLSDSVLNPISQREKMCQYMFEVFEVPKLWIEAAPLLACYSGGRSYGVSIECGEGVTQVIPIHEGYAVKEAIRRVDFGGHDLTDYLTQMLNDERGHSFISSTSSSSHEMTREMKEKLSYVALDFESEMRRAKESPKDFKRDYVLPDGRVIQVGSERFRVGEALFNPSIMIDGNTMTVASATAAAAGSAATTATSATTTTTTTPVGLHHLIYNVIQSCDIDLRKDMYNNIFFGGGTSLMSGAVDRLARELGLLAPRISYIRRTGSNLRIIAPPERLYATWIGGSIVASITSSQPLAITKEEYDECGPLIVHRKCRSL